MAKAIVHALSLLIALLAVGANARTAPVAALAASGPQTRAFDCRRVPILVVLLADNATVYLPDRGLTLTRIAAPPDAAPQYANERSRFSIAGRSARLQIADTLYEHCVENPARAFWQAASLRGASFRAIAADASWVLDVLDPQQAPVLRYAPADGSGALWFRNSTLETTRTGSSGAKHYRAQSATHSLVVSVTTQACESNAVRTNFSSRVQLTIDGRSSSGCGGSVP